MDDIKISSGGKEYRQGATDLLANVFTTDPVIRFMTSDLSEEQHLAYLPSYMGALLKAASLNDAIFQEANGWACTAVWMLPRRKVDNLWTMLPAGLVQVTLRLGLRGVKRMLWDFQRQSDAAKATHLKGYRGYHYLFFIGTTVEARGKGLATNMMKKYRENVQQGSDSDLPIWLEATTAKSRDIYAKCGFEVVQEMKLGKGTHAATGLREKGGPGVSIWAMIWRPASKTKDA